LKSEFAEVTFMKANGSSNPNLRAIEPTQRTSGPRFFLKLFAAVMLVSFLFLPGLAQAQPHGRRPAPQRIKFAVGAVSAHVTGQFTPSNDRPAYVIKAKAGDHMIVNIIPVTKSLTMGGTVKSPKGEGDGGPGGIIMNADLTEGGDYVIEAFQHTMGSNLASGRFVLEIVITPAWLKN
jgi:hypothetical protein